MYFLEIYWFRESTTYLELEGVLKLKSVKNGSLKNMNFCRKSTFLKKFRRGYQNFMLYSDSTYQITLKSVIKDIN